MTTPSANREDPPIGAPASSKPLRAQRWAAKVLVEPDAAAMTSSSSLAAPASSASVVAEASKVRPSGETGGHTVQDWEQPPANPWLGAAQRHAAASAASKSAPPGPVQPSAAGSRGGGEPVVGPLGDEPSPVVVPLYMRPPSHVLPGLDGDGPLPALDPQEMPFDAKRVTLTAQSAALTEAITRHVTDTLAGLLRPAVAYAIADLLPMILSFGSIPDAEAAPAKPAAAAPALGQDVEGLDGEG